MQMHGNDHIRATFVRRMADWSDYLDKYELAHGAEAAAWERDHITAMEVASSSEAWAINSGRIDREDFDARERLYETAREAMAL